LEPVTEGGPRRVVEDSELAVGVGVGGVAVGAGCFGQLGQAHAVREGRQAARPARRGTILRCGTSTAETGSCGLDAPRLVE